MFIAGSFLSSFVGGGKNGEIKRKYWKTLIYTFDNSNDKKLQMFLKDLIF